MKRLFLPLVLLAAVTVAACHGESSLPIATGKGSIRGVNAIETSPDIAFLIEERFQGSIDYTDSTTTSRFDNLEYTFNFNAFRAGDTEPTRIASQTTQVQTDRLYTFVVTGSLSNATVTVWESAIRTFDDTATVFQVQFAHTAASLGSVDVYFAAPGVAPVVGEQRGTLAFGEILDPADIAQGDFVITVTAAGNPSIVHFVSRSTLITSRQELIFSIFNASENSAADYLVTGLGAGGNVTTLPDPRFSATARFIHATRDLVTADIYIDPTLTPPLVSGLAFGDISAEVDVPEAVTTYTFTAENDFGVPLFTADETTLINRRYHYFAIGIDPTTFTIAADITDKRPSESSGKLHLFHAATNHPLINLFSVPAGEVLDDQLPVLVGQPLFSPSDSEEISPGSFDLYVRATGETTNLAGPFRLDVSVRDTIDLMLLDTVDPATLEIRIIPPP